MYDPEREVQWIDRHKSEFLRLELHHVPGYLVACGVTQCESFYGPIDGASAAVRGTELHVDPDALMDIVLLHEAAHLLTSPADASPHSSLWAAVYVDLVRRIKGDDLAASLESVL